MADKKLFKFVPTEYNGKAVKYKKVYTARGNWQRRYRLCRVFGLNPFKPIN